MKPSSAIVALTLQCNARCLMCDIWKHDSGDEMLPEEYLKLPTSLREINLTGGEPLLRHDLLEVMAAIRRACPQARLVLSSNGLLVDRVGRWAPHLARMGDALAVRISIDGIGQTHDRLRGVPHAYTHALESLTILREAGVRDLGIGMTIVEDNLADLHRVHQLAEELGVEFSVTLASDSPIYFGADKSRLRPNDRSALAQQLCSLALQEYRRGQPKHWFRAWFERELARYVLDGRRALPCDAGRGFFYLDPSGGVYPCHLLDGRLGDLRQSSWQALWHAPQADLARREVQGCEQCWMVCTARTQIRANIVRVALQIVGAKIRAHRAI